MSDNLSRVFHTVWQAGLAGAIGVLAVDGADLTDLSLWHAALVAAGAGGLSAVKNWLVSLQSNA